MSAPVLILGAGINGAALARELVLQRQDVCLVDRCDVASGTTAYSSRLIHGGLRYLEYGELSLVRESLAERTRLLQLAPQYVEPLELFIPVRDRTSGLLHSAGKFLGLSGGASTSRGLWLVRAGLAMYDLFARDRTMPRHSTCNVGTPHTPLVDAAKYRWLCSYWDAQITFPERFVVAMLEDARRFADKHGVRLEVFTYHEARLTGGQAQIVSIGTDLDSPAGSSFQDAAKGDETVGPVSTQASAAFRPAAIVNATGAWVDRTLARLSVKSPRLIGGTKGSHLFTRSAALCDQLQGEGLYVESSDGRPVFILPFLDGTLIGTTDIPFNGDPAAARSDAAELDYLIASVNGVLPSAELAREDVDLHYAGVRPLPYLEADTPGAITRKHFLHYHADSPLPLYSIVGGKLTTCRSLAEEAAAVVLARLGETPRHVTRERPLPGAEDFPEDVVARHDMQRDIAAETDWSRQQVAAAWPLFGTRTAEIARQCAESDGRAEPPCLTGTDLPLPLVWWVLEHEWATTLADLVERRLMLHFEPDLSRASLSELAGELVRAGRMAQGDAEAAVASYVQRLETHFGRQMR